MNKSILEGLGKLLCVKSLVTLALTAVFAVMALGSGISQEFMTSTPWSLPSISEPRAERLRE